QVFLTFYGNHRSPSQPADATADRMPADAPPHSALALESPTVAYGTPPREPLLDHDPHESPAVMTLPVVLLGLLALVGGLLDVPLKGLDFLDKWLEPVFSDAPAVRSSKFVGGLGLSRLAVLLGLIGILVAVSFYRRGLPAPDADPLEQRLGGV